MKHSLKNIILLHSIFILLQSVCCQKLYAPGEQVFIFANTISPFQNPSETYTYYSLPFCRPTEKRSQRKTFGEVLVGDNKRLTPYEIKFKENIEWKVLCHRWIYIKEIQNFRNAIENNYLFEMFVDDLPMWGYVGQVLGSRIKIPRLISHIFLYSHTHFTFGYNGNQIVSANISMDSLQKVDISDPTNSLVVTFSYSVSWVHEPSLQWKNRMSRYIDNHFFPKNFEIHWISIINAFVLVILLMIFLAYLLMRILKNDFIRYVQVQEEKLTEKELGWKLIRGDVFRVPNNLNLLSAFLGAGAQLCLTTILLLSFVLFGLLRATEKGALLSAMITLYTVTSFANGFTSARFYRQFGGRKWPWNIILSAFIFPLPLFIIFLIVNSIASFNSSTSALNSTAISDLVLQFIEIILPLHLLGGIVGKNITTEFKSPCRITKIPREIPIHLQWSIRTILQIFIAGFLPFRLLLITGFVTIILAYFQLAAQDYNWWWKSIIQGGSTGFFIYIYSLFYFFNRSPMDGFLQSAFYFGYMLIISYGFFLMLGFIGFVSTFSFVYYIYNEIKFD